MLSVKKHIVEKVIQNSNLDVIAKESAPEYLRSFPEVVDLWRQQKAMKAFFDEKLIDLTCGLNVWLYNGMFYIIPYGERFFHDLNNIPSLITSVEDFCYYNNADPPDDIPDDEWEMREDIWDIILDEKNKEFPCWRNNKFDYNIFDSKDQLSIHYLIYSTCGEKLDKMARAIYQLKKDENEKSII